MDSSEMDGTPTVPEMSGQYVCAVCGERFRSEGELRSHGRTAGLVD